MIELRRRILIKRKARINGHYDFRYLFTLHETKRDILPKKIDPKQYNNACLQMGQSVLS